MSRAWRIVNNWLVTVAIIVIAAVLTYSKLPAKPWMEPAFEIRVDRDGRPRFTFTGIINEATPAGTYGVDIKADLGGGVEQDVCRGGYDPSDPPNYSPDETPPRNRTFDWLIEKYSAEDYPGGCEAQLLPGRTHIMLIGWCRAPGVDCVHATARWKQPG